MAKYTLFWYSICLVLVFVSVVVFLFLLALWKEPGLVRSTRTFHGLTGTILDFWMKQKKCSRDRVQDRENDAKEKKKTYELKQHQVILFSWGKWWLVWREVTEEVTLAIRRWAKPRSAVGNWRKVGEVLPMWRKCISVSFLWALRCGLEGIFVMEVMIELECYSSSSIIACCSVHSLFWARVFSNSLLLAHFCESQLFSDSLIDDNTLLESRKVSANASPRSRRWIWT